MLRVGTGRVEGTKQEANEKNGNSVRYDRAGQVCEQLRAETEVSLGRQKRAGNENAPGPRGGSPGGDWEILSERQLAAASSGQPGGGRDDAEGRIRMGRISH